MFRLDGGCGTDSSTSRRRLRSRSTDGARRVSPAPAGEPVDRLTLTFGRAVAAGRAFFTARGVLRAAVFVTFAAPAFALVVFLAFLRFGAADLRACFWVFRAFF